VEPMIFFLIKKIQKKKNSDLPHLFPSLVGIKPEQHEGKQG